MTTVTLSTKGQIVIPLDVRRDAGLNEGDRIVVHYDPSSQRITLTRKETLREMATRLGQYIKPGTPPLEDASGLYSTRKPRL